MIWKTAICQNCGNEFRYIISQRNGTYCSKECQNARGGRADYPCAVCGTMVNRVRSQVKTTVYCSRECSLSTQRRKAVLYCAFCNTPFEGLPGRDKYCSMPCYRKARKGALAGADNVAYIPRTLYTCAWCGAGVERLPSELKGTVYCSRACADKGKTQLTGATRYNYKGGPYPMACEICGTIKMVRHAHVDRFRACSRACAAEIGRRAWPRTSSLETAMLQAFAYADLVVAPQYPVGYYTVDFAIPDAMLIIECDGIYWHSLPKQQVRDRNKDAWLTRHGWTMLRLTEAEIRRSPADCVVKVKHLLATLE